MNERDFIPPKSKASEPPTFRTPNLSRAKFFKIKASLPNYGQYATTINAYASAGMPFEHIANAGEQLGDPVERGEIDAPLQMPNSPLKKMGEVIEEQNQISAWQDIGQISVIPQIASPNNISGSELVTTTSTVNTNQNLGEQTLNVVEGISAESPASHIGSGNTVPQNTYPDNMRFIGPLNQDQLNQFHKPTQNNNSEGLNEAA